MLKKHPSFPGIEGPILTVIMDGVGLNASPIGNAVLHANTPTLDRLAQGKAIGMHKTSRAADSHGGIFNCALRETGLHSI